MKQVVIVYDDRNKPSQEIATINGGRSFGHTIYKRKTLFEITRDKAGSSVMWLEASSESGQQILNNIAPDAVVCVILSEYMVSDIQTLEVLIKKASFARENYRIVCDGKLCMYILADKGEFLSYLAGETISESAPAIETQGFLHLGDQASFLSYITGGFDARFFNSLEGDYHTVTKKSSNVEKIKKEYSFYYLLPDNMKHYFVQPYDYIETDNVASYTMERYHMTDVAIRYVHGAVSLEELSELLDELFTFIDSRESKQVEASEYKKICDNLYIDKVAQRIAELKRHSEYTTLAGYIRGGTDYDSIDDIFEEYKTAYNNLADKQASNTIAIGHGDLCFSNILFQRDAHLMRLIDPKGALTKEEMYTDPCYDLAKLSHSICGNYDFFNSGQYEICVADNMRLSLRLENENSGAISLFRDKLQERGFSFERIRLYEASLFLSMLPLHMDNPRKVLGFILNAIDIMHSI